MEKFLSSDKRICFLVISVMKPWNCSTFDFNAERSVFSDKERINQTIDTVRSINQKIPSADIIVVEGGKRLDVETIDYINAFGGKVFYVGRWIGVRRAVSGKSKAFGEIALMVCAKIVLSGFRKYDYIYKISGRYRLNEDFDIMRWRMDKICGKDVYGDHTEISTRLIGIPRCMINIYYKALLRRIWKVPFKPTVLEGYVMKGIGLDNICFISPIGVEGWSGGYHKERQTKE